MITARILGNPKASIVFEGGDDNISMAFSYTSVGDKGLCTRQQIGTTWTSLDTGSCANIRVIIGRNTSTTSSLQIATDSNGTNIVTTAQMGDPIFLPWSGSQLFWGKCSPSASTIPIIFQEW
jgi:hypothetical protein